jgi:hypothetical protein
MRQKSSALPEVSRFLGDGSAHSVYAAAVLCGDVVGDHLFNVGGLLGSLFGHYHNFLDLKNAGSRRLLLHVLRLLANGSILSALTGLGVNATRHCYPLPIDDMVVGVRLLARATFRMERPSLRAVSFAD